MVPMTAQPGTVSESLSHEQRFEAARHSDHQFWVFKTMNAPPGTPGT